MRGITPQLWMVFAAVLFLAGCGGSGSNSAEQADGITTVDRYVSTAAKAGTLKESRPPSRAVELRDAQNQLVGAARLRPTVRDRLEIELDTRLALRFFPAKVVIYGHETSGFEEECDEIALVANTGGANDIAGIAELLDAGVFPAPKSMRRFNASFRGISSQADSIAIWSGGNGTILLACGDF